MKCKFVEKSCLDRYHSESKTKHGFYCRLKEWRKKHGVCRYDPNIRSTMKIRQGKIPACQTRLPHDD